MFDILTFIVAILATFRVTSLIVEDTITEPLREFWWRRFPTSGFHYERWRVTQDETQKQNNGTVRSWPFTRRVDHVGGMWVSLKSYKLGELIECPYCISVWVAAAATVFLNQILSLPYDGYTFLNFLAIAGGTEVLNNRFGRP